MYAQPAEHDERDHPLRLIPERLQLPVIRITSGLQDRLDQIIPVVEHRVRVGGRVLLRQFGHDDQVVHETVTVGVVL